MPLSYSEINYLKEIAKKFQIAEGEITHVIPVDGGRINSSFKITVTQENDTVSYLLQKINARVFSDVNAVMKNALLVTKHLREKGIETLEYVPTKTGEYIFDNYRMMKFIHAEIFQSITRPKDIFNLGLAVGRFSSGLSDFNANRLVDTIPNFHNTQIRYEDFLASAVNYTLNFESFHEDESRVKRAEKEIKKVYQYKDLYGEIVNAIMRRKIPLRVTHNDTKLNNVLFDRKQNTPRCLIDLDTVMKGSVLYDLADAIRSGANVVNEDAGKTFGVMIDLDLLRAFLEGFKEGAPGYLTKNEIKLLPVAIQILPLELGMRYLTDYFNHDTYFAISNPDDNYNRARIQLELAGCIENNMEYIKEIVEEVFGD